MRLTNAEIVQYFRDITEIINRREKYPVRFSFALLKNYRALEPENRNIEEARNRLLDEYNRKDRGRQMCEWPILFLKYSCKNDRKSIY